MPRKKTPETPKRVWILAQPRTESAPSIAARGKGLGYTITAQHVHNVRHEEKRRQERQKAGRRPKVIPAAALEAVHVLRASPEELAARPKELTPWPEVRDGALARAASAPAPRTDRERDLVAAVVEIGTVRAQELLDRLLSLSLGKP